VRRKGAPGGLSRRGQHQQRPGRHRPAAGHDRWGRHLLAAGPCGAGTPVAGPTGTDRIRRQISRRGGHRGSPASGAAHGLVSCPRRAGRARGGRRDERAGGGGAGPVEGSRSAADVHVPGDPVAGVPGQPGDVGDVQPPAEQRGGAEDMPQAVPGPPAGAAGGAPPGGLAGGLEDRRPAAKRRPGPSPANAPASAAHWPGTRRRCPRRSAPRSSRVPGGPVLRGRRGIHHRLHVRGRDVLAGQVPDHRPGVPLAQMPLRLGVLARPLPLGRPPGRRVAGRQKPISSSPLRSMPSAPAASRTVTLCRRRGPQPDPRQPAIELRARVRRGCHGGFGDLWLNASPGSPCRREEGLWHPAGQPLRGTPGPRFTSCGHRRGHGARAGGDGSDRDGRFGSWPPGWPRCSRPDSARRA